MYLDERTEKEKIACACQYIRNSDDELLEAENIDLEFLDEKPNLTFDLVKALLNRLDNFDAAGGFQEYCDRFIVDALIGNTDRHNGNWGVIVNGDTVKIAPVYDCGSSLSPLLADNELTEKITADNALNVMSVIMDNMGNRLNYRDFLMSGTNNNINLALKK